MPHLRSGYSAGLPRIYEIVRELILTACLTEMTIQSIHFDNLVILWKIGILIFAGFFQAALSLVNWASSMMIHPNLLPRMDFSEELPRESATLIAVPEMLSDVNSIAALLNAMRFFSSRHGSCQKFHHPFRHPFHLI